MFPVIMRARACMLSLFVLIFFITFRKYGFKSFTIIPIFVIVLFFIEGDYLVDIFRRSFLGSSNINDIESLTSGRSSRASDAIAFILKYPLFGALNDVYYIFNPAFRIPHQFLLWKLVKYGILGSLPYIVVYISLIIYSIRLFRHKCIINDVTLINLSSAIILSFAEYSAPFGPATSFIICYIVTGYSFKYNINMVTTKYLKNP